MNTYLCCPCGISRGDCTYHKPTKIVYDGLSLIAAFNELNKVDLSVSKIISPIDDNEKMFDSIW